MIVFYGNCDCTNLIVVSDWSSNVQISRNAGLGAMYEQPYALDSTHERETSLSSAQGRSFAELVDEASP